VAEGACCTRYTDESVEETLKRVAEAVIDKKKNNKF
jgi:hypothetical protein